MNEKAAKVLRKWTTIMNAAGVGLTQKELNGEKATYRNSNHRERATLKRQWKHWGEVTHRARTRGEGTFPLGRLRGNSQ